MPNESQPKILLTKNKTDFEELQVLYEVLYEKVVTVVNSNHLYDHSDSDEYDDLFDADSGTPTEPWRSIDHLQATYESFRREPYYLAIKKSIENNEQVYPAEYLFYALVTDKVGTLNPNKLEQHHDIQLKLTHPHNPHIIKSISPFLPNIKILVAALRHQNNPKNKTLKQLSLLLNQRHHIQNRLNLNLSGIDLPGINLQRDALIFDDCYFADAKLDSHLNFKAFFCVFLRTQLSNEPKYHHHYRYCTLTDIDTTIHYLDDNLTLDHIKFHQCKLTFKTNRNKLMLSDCNIFKCHIAIQTTEKEAKTRLHRCKANQSTLTFHEGIMNLWKNEFTQTVITRNLIDHSAGHCIDNNIFYDCDLRSGAPMNASDFVSSQNRFPHEQHSLIYGHQVFESPETFNTFLNEFQMEFRQQSRYTDTEKIQKAFAHTLIAHIRLYCPVEAYPIEHVALLEQALKHPAFSHYNPDLEYGTPGHLFAAYSTGKKAHDVLNKALNDALPDRLQHTALSRLTSF